MKKQSATNRQVNEVSKVTPSHVHYNRSAAAQFPSQVIPELNSKQAPDSVLFPWHFAQKAQTGWRIILTCKKLFSPPMPQWHPCVQYWHRGCSRNAAWHSTSLCCTSPWHGATWSHQGSSHTRVKAAWGPGSDSPACLLCQVNLRIEQFRPAAQKKVLQH